MKKLLLTSAIALSAMAGYAQCQAGFTYAAAPVNNNVLQEQFVNTSTLPTGGGANAYSIVTINYGDVPVNYSFGSSATHNYGAPGTYTVKVRTAYYADSLTNTLTCSDSSVQQVMVGYPCAGTMVYGNVNGTIFSYNVSAFGNSNLAYVVNYGDGSPVGNDSIGSHVYTTPGTYNVTITTSGGGCTYTNTYTVTIATTTGCAGNNAAFTVTNVGNYSATFTNTSTTGSGTLSSAVYDYGDGTSDATGMHTYTAYGYYYPILYDTWTDANGNVTCTDSTTSYVYIPGAPAIVGAISGNVIVDSSVVGANLPDSIVVYLIRFDSVSNSLSAIATHTLVGNYGGYYSFSNESLGNYLVKAVPFYPSVAAGLSGLVPTYDSASLYWSAAASVVLAGNNSYNNNVYMQFGTVTTGPGFISGNVSLGANKNTNAGVPNLLIFLRDANNNLVASTYTDNTGNFSFANLPLGTYDVYPENINYTTTSLSGIVLDAANNSMTDASFYQDNSQYNIKPHATGISSVVLAANAVTLFPNPAKGNVTLNWSDARLNNATVSISNVAGQVVYTGTLGTGASKVIGITSLNAGVYFVRLTGAGITANKKLVIE